MTEYAGSRAPRDGNEPGEAVLMDGLRRLGYDIETDSRGDQQTGEIIARRDLEDRGILLAVDRSGRFRVEITWVVGEWPSRLDFAGIAVRSIDRVTRSVSLVGQVDEPREVLQVINRLDRIVPWAGGDNDEPAPETDGPILPDSRPPS